MDFLKRSETLHKTCFNRGGMLVAFGDEGNSCLIRLMGLNVSAVVAECAAGFYMGAAEMFGVDDIRCEVTLRSAGADFLLGWDLETEESEPDPGDSEPPVAAVQ